MSNVILFQGDSITDAGRNRTTGEDFGQGYANLVASKLGYTEPGKYTFYNRGVSGDRSVDIYARIKQDLINLKPDYMSILVGVNDVGHELAFKNGVDTAKFEKIYNMLIAEVKEALPDIKIMLLEPFLLPGPGTLSVPNLPDAWEPFIAGVRDHAQAVRRVAEANGLAFIPLQDKFDELNAKYPGVWSPDGVHPSIFGHQLIMEEWLKVFETL